MPKIYTYSVSIPTDSIKLQEKLRDRLEHYRTLRPDRILDWGGLFLDGFESIDLRIWKRPAAMEMYKRVLSGDFVLFIGNERIFNTQSDLIKRCEALSLMGAHAILDDYRIDLSTVAGRTVFDLLKKFEHFALNRRKAMRPPKIV